MRPVGRQRENNRNDPKGWERAKNGTIYFRPTNAVDREIVLSITHGPLSLRLGRTYDEAHVTFTDLIVKERKKRKEQQLDFVPGTVAELVFKAREKGGYLDSIKNPETRAWRARHVDELLKEFGARRYAYSEVDIGRAPRGTYIQKIDINRYLKRNAAARPVAANRAVATWHLVWKEAESEWDLAIFNPCAGAKYNEELPRTVLPRDDQFFKLMPYLDPPYRGILYLGRYYGRRPGEGRNVDLPDEKNEGLTTVRGKRARELILVWDDVEFTKPDGTQETRPGRLRKLLNRQLRWREEVAHPTKVWKNGKRPKAPAEIDPKALFINRKGKRITKTGFYSAIRRAMEEAGMTELVGIEVLAGGKERRRTKRDFNPNDTRAKRATTLPRGVATEVLAHDEERTTQVHYNRGPLYIRVPDEKNSRKRSKNSRKIGGEPDVGP